MIGYLDIVSRPGSAFYAHSDSEINPGKVHLLQLFVGKVDDELLESVAIRRTGFESVQVQDSDGPLLPRCLDLKFS